jgi:hypothetical protein
MLVALQKGGTATVLSLAGDRITVLSTIPSAPGSRLDGALASGGALRIKVASCRKHAEGFTIEGRLIDTIRAVRVEIDAWLSLPPG